MNQSNFDHIYESFRNINFLYNINLDYIPSYFLYLDEEKKFQYKNAKDISPAFYEGFGFDI